MADLDNDTTSIIDDDRPLSVRRTRRSSSIPSSPYSRNPSHSRNTTSHPHGIATPPSTPKRTKKKVRFSDPGPARPSDFASSGLTPFIRRTSLSTPKSRRRQSTPVASTPRRLWNTGSYSYDVASSEPANGILQFAPLRQVLEGRVKRRIKRRGLSEEGNVIEFDKRVEARGRKSEVERLREELERKDAEVQSMRDEFDIASQIEGESGHSVPINNTLASRVQELEQEIRDLKEEVGRREKDGDTIDETQVHDWTLNARDPYDHEEDDDEMMITNYDEDFEDMTNNDELMTTPTRLNTSFPSPPSTMPNTPCRSYSMSAGIQASLPIPDPENEVLKEQLQGLQAEIAKLAKVVALNEDNAARLSEKLAEFMPVDESHDQGNLDAALDTVLTQLALTQSQSLEHSTAFSALRTEITSLGFSGSSPDEALAIIAKQFRQARLDLEHLTPGEIAEGFENEILLPLLIKRIKALLEKVKQGDQNIDQYHSQELLLRQQLNDRVSVMDDLKTSLSSASTTIIALRSEVADKETDSARLRAALEGYRSEVTSLETLISRVEKEGRETERGLRSEVDELQRRLENEKAQHDVAKAVNEGNEILLPELERRLSRALEKAADVQAQLEALTKTHEDVLKERDAALAQISNHSSTISRLEERENIIAELKSGILDREQAHGSALALRDARVSELRDEIERVNEALKSAHSTILSLRNENKEVKERAERGRFVVRDMLRQMGRAEEMGRGFADFEDVATVVTQRRSSIGGEGLCTPNVVGEGSVVRKGGMFDPGMARRSSAGRSGKKRRRYDSGLGFLEEGEEGEESEMMEVEV